jgi:hypothetical protein
VQVIVENHQQARKVRFVFWFIALYCAGMVYWAYDLAQTYGLSPGDGGVLRSAWERAVAAAIVAALGIAPVIGMIVYVRLYVTRLTRDGDTITVSVIGVLGSDTRPYAVADVSRATEYSGRFRLWSRVDAPWIVLRLAGRPYIIDLQSELVNRSAIEALLRDREKIHGGQ